MITPSKLLDITNSFSCGVHKEGLKDFIEFFHFTPKYLNKIDLVQKSYNFEALTQTFQIEINFLKINPNST